jgi:chromosome segregation ATPase
MDWGWIPLAAAIVAPVGAYLLAARRFSGDIAKTDANALLEESRAIRADYRDQLVKRDKRISDLDKRIEVLEREKDNLSKDNYELRVEVLHCRALVKTHEASIATLEALVRTLENNIKAQKQSLSSLADAAESQKREMEK